MITTEQFAGIVGKAWPQAITPVNIMSGFKSVEYTCLIQEMLQTDKLHHLLSSLEVTHCLMLSQMLMPTDSLCRKQYEEGYDLYNVDYLQWIHQNNLKLPTTNSVEINTSGSSSLPVETSSE